MDKLKNMQVFVYVAQNGSFAKAATHFSVSSTMIGKHVKSLEAQLGVKLLNRTTRKQSLTEAGQIYLVECERILSDIADAENNLQTIENKPKGTVRINSPVTYGNLVLAPLIADFLHHFPDINIELVVDNARIDPMHERFDIVFRVGELADSTLIARRLPDYEMLFAASPDYISDKGEPVSQADLVNHHCLGFSYSDIQPQLAVGIETHAFDRQHTRLLSNSGQALKVAAEKGAGVVLQPRLILSDALCDGVLIEVLKDERPKAMPVHMLYKSKQLPLKTRTFVDFVLAVLVK
ncbi:LysR family transcriptional regulator [Photobacterium proteolyticum]|uniref:LysR family transcriptional regulator n=1 Tax=Photobacterium proteolyticum TaxID=1903952 RepID=A0A1Q9GYZ2_9GAMM|nr:LysR substrate-binding domain-containing protein [Photobacterium proteolyticum]OLQ80514.1 LysR family transcriptional regulator [Photobacterium proteolyticum]